MISGGTNNYVNIASASNSVDLVLELGDQFGNILVDQLGNPYRTNLNDSSNNTETLLLGGLSPGIYMAGIYDFYQGQFLFSETPYSLTINAPPPADLYDSVIRNDTLNQATILEVTGGGEYLTDLSIDNRYDIDWFQFTTTEPSSWEHYLQINFDNQAGNLDLILWDQYGYYYAPFDTNSNSETIFLAGLPEGTYYVQVGSYYGHTHPNYELIISTPQGPQPDALDFNDSILSASDLESISGRYLYTEPLSIHNSSDVDWFQFETNGIGTFEHSIAISFDSIAGDLGLALYDSQGYFLGYSDNYLTDTEAVSLVGLPQGTYYAQVYSYLGQTNDYLLVINAPGETTQILPDRLESNNSLTNATNLAVIEGLESDTPLEGFSSWQNLSINDSDEDWFEFKLGSQGTERDFVAIAFDTLKGDLDLILYDSGGKFIEEAKGVRNVEQISLQGLDPGDYYVQVVGYDGATNPNYTLFLNAPGDPFEPNNDEQAAKNLTTITGVRTYDDLSIGTESDLDWFRFSLVSQGTGDNSVRIDFNHNLGDLDIALYRNTASNPDDPFNSENTNINLESVDVSEGVTNQEEISLEGLSAGEYFLKVYGFDGDTNNYSLTIDAPGNPDGDKFEEEGGNNTREIATSLNKQIQGQGQDQLILPQNSGNPLSLHKPGDVDWYEFEMDETGKDGDFAAIIFDHTLGDLDLALYDESETEVISDGISNIHQISLKGKDAGTYHLKVFGFDDATNPNYSLVINASLPAIEQTEPQSDEDNFDKISSNNTLETATDLGKQSNSIFNLSIHSASDRDWFKFNLANEGEFNHSARINFNHNQGDLDIKLYDMNGNEIDSSTGVTGEEEISLAGLSGGDYYLEIYGYNQAENRDYTLFLNLPTAEDWAESNDNNNTPYDLRHVEGLQSWEPLSIHEVGNEDWFKFTIQETATEDHSASIIFDQTLGDLDLYLYQLDETKIDSSETANNLEQVNLGGLSANSYLLKVAGHNNATNPNYQLVINAPTEDTGDWSEENNTQASAYELREVQGTQVYSGLSLHQIGDEDWFKFETSGTGVTGHSVSIEFDNTEGNLDLELHNSSDTLIASSTSDSNRERISLEEKDAGTYYVKVLGKDNTVTNPNYSLIIYAPQEPEIDWAEGEQNNNNLDNAYNLRTIDETLALTGLSIHPSNDEDWFKFTLDKDAIAGQVARIDFNHFEGDLQLEIFDGNDNNLGQSNTDKNFEEISLAGLSTETTYYVKVSGINGDPNPEYSLTIVGTPQSQPDRLEPNDSPSNAYELRELTNTASASSQLVSRRIYGGLDNLSHYWDGVAGPSALAYSPHLTGAFYNLQGEIAGAGFQPGGYLQRLAQGNYTPTQIQNALSFPINGIPALFTTPTLNDPLGNQQYEQLLNPSLFRPIPNNTWFDNSLNSVLGLPSSGGSFNFNNNLNFPTSPFSTFGVASSAILGDFNIVNNFNQRIGLAANSGIFANNQFSTFGVALSATLRDFNIVNNFNQRIGLVANSGIFANNQFAAASSNLDPLLGLLGLNFRNGNSQNLALVPDLSIHTNADKDWFKFELNQDGETGQFIAINFDHDLGDLQLELFEAFDTNANTTETQYQKYLVELANGDGDTEQISLAGLAQGEYYIRVSGEVNPNYNLTLSAPPLLDSTGDFTEPNNSSSNAYDLREVEGTRFLSGLSIHNQTDTDWFQFTTKDMGKDSHVVRIDFSHAQGDLDLILQKPDGTTIASETTENFEEISLNGLAAGTYKVKVLGYSGASNPSYNLSIIAPDTTIDPDNLEPNNDFANATLLDQNGNISSLNGLSIHQNDRDFFNFTTQATGNAANSVSIQFEQAQGDLQLELYDKDNLTTPIQVSNGTSNNETISLEDLPPDTYFIKVLGKGSATNNYQLYLDTPIETNALEQNDWTILVYMTASDLQKSAFDDINEMEFAASFFPSNVNFAVFWDQSSFDPNQQFATGTQAKWGTAGRAIIQADTDPESVATTFDISIGEKNTGDLNTLVEFIDWAKTAAPAENYALILWDHGGGDLGGFNVDNEGNSHNISADRLFTNELTTALANVDIDFNLIAFDACLMAMAEAGYALRGHTDIFVASEENENGAGYDYTTAFSALISNPELVTGEALASSIITSYQQQYQGDTRGLDTQSATDVSKFVNFASKLKAFTGAALSLTSPDAWNAIHDARDAASFFTDSFYRDLGQFLQGIANRTNTAISTLKTVAQEAYDALQNLIIDKTQDRRNTEGLSIYFPDSNTSIDNDYLNRNQTFLTATDWDDFLNALQTRTPNRSIAVLGDWAEANDVSARAYNFNTLLGDGHQFTALSLHTPSDEDWYRFTLNETAVAGDKVNITYDKTNSLFFLLRYTDANGQIQERTATETNTGQEISLDTLPQGEYRIQVKADGSVIPEYSLTVDAPGTPNDGKDWARGNNLSTKAEDLGVITAETQFAGLQVDRLQPDWFEFELPKINSDQITPVQVTVNLVSSQTATAELFYPGDTDTPIASETGTGELQLTTPDPLPGQTYQLQISQADDREGAIAYSLHFEPEDLEDANNPPTISNINKSGKENITFASFDFTSAFSDVDGDSLNKIQITSLPTNGVLKLGEANVSINQEINTSEIDTLIFIPEDNFQGSVSFSWKGFDGREYSESTATVTLTINPVNDLPVANDDTYSVDEDNTLTVDAATGVLANDSDDDGDDLSVSLSTNVSNGTLTLNSDGSFEYTPNANFNGSDSFTYEVSDSNGGTDTATVTLTINPVNDLPIANDDTYTLDEDTTLTIEAVDAVLANDSDIDGDSLSVSLDTNVSNGTLTLNNNGSFDYTPNANFNGTDSFTYEVSDGNGGTDIGTVNLTINPTQTEPSAMTLMFGNGEVNLPSEEKPYIVFCGAGQDLIKAYGDNSHGSPFPDRLYSGNGPDQILLGTGDRAFAGKGDDTLDGSNGGGENRLFGGKGNDTLIVGNKDLAVGGSGADTFVWKTGDNNLIPEQNLVLDFQSLDGDKIDLTQLTIDGEPVSFNDLSFTEGARGTELGILGLTPEPILAIFWQIGVEDLSSPDNFIL